MQVTETLTNEQKLKRLLSGCSFRYNPGQAIDVTYKTSKSTLPDNFWLERGNHYLTLVETKQVGNMLLVPLTLFGVTNTYPIDLSLVEIL